MAQTAYGVNSPEAVKVWSKALFREALKACNVSKFIGSDDGSVLQQKDELKKSAGDRMTLTLRMQLTGAGVQGDATLEGNEEALTTFTDNLFIDQLRHAVRSKGKMSEQRIPWSVREESKNGLRDWWADRIDLWFYNQVCGYTPQADTRYTGLQPVLAATTIRRINGVANDQSLGTGDTFSLQVIDDLIAQAQTATPMIRPIKVKGEDRYPVILHTYQARDLRKNTNAGQWLDIQKAAMQGGELDGNGLRTGSLGVYNKAILYESERITPGVNSSTGASVANTRRAVLLGAQAAVIGFGGSSTGITGMDWNEELFDYSNQLGVEAGLIAGLKKTQFNSNDFGTIVVPSYAA